VVPDAQVTEAVRFCVLLSLYVPVAVNCCVAPLAIEGFAGVTAIDCSVAGVTVNTVEPLIAPEVALIVLVPTATPLARPPAVMVAVVVVPDAQVTEAVRFCVLLSLYVPVAVNCCVAPLAIEGFAGVTAIDCSVAGVTVNTVEPLIAPEVALIVLVPTATPLARPPAVMVAVVVVPDAQVTEAVRFCVLLSLYVPVAVNCCVAPLAIEGFAGVTAIDCSVAGVTVNTVEPLIAPEVALIVLVPTATPLARPPAAMVATVVVPDAQVTEAVRFCVLLSLYVPVAVNCCVAPLAIEGFAAVAWRGAGFPVNGVEPLIAPEVALIVLVPPATPLARPPAAMVATASVADAQVTEPVRFAVLLSLY